MMTTAGFAPRSTITGASAARKSLMPFCRRLKMAARRRRGRCLRTKFLTRQAHLMVEIFSSARACLQATDSLT
jgi:hypothetical protein